MPEKVGNSYKKSPSQGRKEARKYDICSRGYLYVDVLNKTNKKQQKIIDR